MIFYVSIHLHRMPKNVLCRPRLFQLTRFGRREEEEQEKVVGGGGGGRLGGGGVRRSLDPSTQSTPPTSSPSSIFSCSSSSPSPPTPVPPPSPSPPPPKPIFLPPPSSTSFKRSIKSTKWSIKIQVPKTGSATCSFLLLLLPHLLLDRLHLRLHLLQWSLNRQ